MAAQDKMYSVCQQSFTRKSQDFITLNILFLFYFINCSPPILCCFAVAVRGHISRIDKPKQMGVIYVCEGDIVVIRGSVLLVTRRLTSG